MYPIPYYDALGQVMYRFLRVPDGPPLEPETVTFIFSGETAEEDESC